MRCEAAREFFGDVCAGPSRMNRGSSEGSMLANRPTSAADALYPCDSYLTLQWWASREKKITMGQKVVRPWPYQLHARLPTALLLVHR